MKRVLIVDDENRLLQSVEAGLEGYKHEFKVHVAGNGKEAINVLKTVTADLVVTDLRMPEMDGFQLLAALSNSHPFMPTIVMTAFATPEIEERLSIAGTIKLLEKPIDIERLAEAIRAGLRQEASDGLLAGFSLANFLQLLSMEQKTCLLSIKFNNNRGHIFLERGDIKAAVANRIKGEEALYLMLASDDVHISFQKLPKKKIPQMINTSLMSLLIEGMRRKDEQSSQLSEGELNRQPEGTETKKDVKGELQQELSSEIIPENVHLKNPVDKQAFNKGDFIMSKLDDALTKFNDIEGFMAAGVFTPNGEMAGEFNKSNMKLAEIGSLANDVLLKAQKATDIMNVGRGQVVHVESPEAHVIARCLNENASFSTTESGKAHIHMVVLLSKDANLAMGKMRLESVIHEVAESFR
jgi:DNA-binding response OmpR family regulator/predicted regulator of Ras-like GTPase activity (Roadblock/LC7/MglB family)